jgi:hypothetical protein
MNTKTFSGSFVVATLLCLALSMVAGTAQSIAGTAKVLRLKGHGRWAPAGESWRPLKAGDVLPSGSVIETDKEVGTLADLALLDSDGSQVASASGPDTSWLDNSPPPTRMSTSPQNTLRLWENTHFALKKLEITTSGIERVTDTQLELTSGRISGKARKLSAGSVYEIKIPGGLAGIKGTTYDIAAVGILRVLEGIVVIAYIDAGTGNVVTQAVSAGQAFDIRSALMSYLSSSDQRMLDITLQNIRSIAPQTYLPYSPDYSLDRISPGKGKGKGKGHNP